MPKEEYVKAKVKLSRDLKGRPMIKLIFPTKSARKKITRYLAKT